MLIRFKGWRTIVATFFVLLLCVIDAQSTELPKRHFVFLQPEQLSAVELDRALDQVANTLTERSLERRRKVISREPPIRRCDLPISAERISAIEATGCKVVLALRYLRAVSVEGSEEALTEVKRLSYVRGIRPVHAEKSLIYRQDRLSKGKNNLSFLQKSESKISTVQLGSGIHQIDNGFNNDLWAIDNADDYGVTWTQLSQVNVPRAHDLGYRGEGIIIGMQDTGFDNLEHDCFEYLDIVGAYDFVNGDDNVGDEGDHGVGRHGTMTLSVVAGLDSGQYIGVAPDARFVLAKTENTESERPVEEDYWVAGLWYHDSLGVDVVSSSLSYREWYEYEDRDGRTGIATRAADSAAAAGMVIVNSMGNTGNQEYPDTKMGIPSDGRSVIAVGGVRADSSYWYLSSQGPTYDGRIKPDVVTLGAGVYTAYNIGNSRYSPRSGTSFSCPMVAGIAGLILQANSALTPEQVMNIIHETSSNAEAPDTLTGYGVVNAYAAVRMAENMSTIHNGHFIPQDYQISAYPNPFNGQVRISFQITNGNPANLLIYDLTGRELLNRQFSTNGIHSLSWDGRYGGMSLSSGTYLCRLSQDGSNDIQKLLLLR